jgi:hypothetical protein
LKVHALAGHKKRSTLRDDQYVQESAWFQLRQAAHHWTTVVTLLIGDPVGVIPQAGHFKMRLTTLEF